MSAIVTSTQYTAAQSTKTSTQTQSASTSFDEELQKATDTQASTTSKTPKEIIAEYKAMSDGALSKDIFEAQIANFTKKHEEEFKRDYPLYEKYKDVFTPKYSNYTRQKAESLARELNAQFPEYKTLNHNAHYGGTQEDMDKFNACLADYMAYNRYLHDKYDLDMGLGMSYGTEGSRAYNYAVYEQLENGASLADATEMAASVAMEFGGREANGFQMMGLMGYPDSMEEAMQTSEGDKEIHYDTQIDLRAEGISHNFAYTNYEVLFGTDKEGIKRRLSYELDLYKFLTENEGLVEQKVKELKERSPEWYEFKHGDEDYAGNLKASFQNSYKVAQFAKNIFDKYGDSIFKNDTSRTNQELAQKAEMTKNKIKNSAEQESAAKTEKSALEALIQEGK
jgi:hypothetical protein